jgi:hypothetical protein
MQCPLLVNVQVWRQNLKPKESGKMEGGMISKVATINKVEGGLNGRMVASNRME